MKARDLIGYGMLYFMVNFVLVLFLMWFFARTFVVCPACPAVSGSTATLSCGLLADALVSIVLRCKNHTG